MGHATLDRVLALLVAGMATTGLLALKAGGPDASWIFTAHGLLGGSLLAATLWKLRRSTPGAVAGRRWGRLALASLVSLAAVGALIGGFAWVVSGGLLSIGSLTVLTLHAWLGLALVPILAVHLLPRRWRVVSNPPHTGISRRTLLATGGLALAGVATFGLAALADRWRGGVRRFTGSRWLPTGGIPPVTTFYGEGPPSIDPATWRLTIGDRTIGLAELRAIGEVDRTAVLDCTSGWAIEIDLDGRAAAGRAGDPRARQRSRAVGDRLVDGPDRRRGADGAPRDRRGRRPATGGERCPVPARRPGTPRPRLDQVGRRGTPRLDIHRDDV